MVKFIGTIIPTASELDRFVDEHPIVSLCGALAVYVSGSNLIKALTAPKGSSPYSASYTNGVANMGIAAEGPEAWLKHEKASSLAHLSKSQKEKLEKIQTELKAASKMHSGQADRLKELGGLGASTSTTTSTSASHAMMPKEAAPTLLERTGASSGMFGRMRSTPPSLRRRIAQSVGLGSAPSHFTGKQQFGAKREEIKLEGAVANLYSMDGFVPETAEDMVVI